MIAQTSDLFAVQEMVIARALPNPMPARAALAVEEDEQGLEHFDMV